MPTLLLLGSHCPSLPCRTSTLLLCDKLRVYLAKGPAFVSQVFIHRFTSDASASQGRGRFRLGTQNSI